MSEFNKPKDCFNGCGTVIYFDPNSLVGHPTPDKWLALEYKEGRKTDIIHNCPNKTKQQNGSSSLTTTTKSESLNFAETLCQVLQDYIRLKRLEAGGEAKK